MEATAKRVNATTLDALYKRVAGIKKVNGDDFAVCWLCDGIVYGSASGRMTIAAETALVNMSDSDIVDLLEIAVNHNRTMGDMARFVNEQYGR